METRIVKKMLGKHSKGLVEISNGMGLHKFAHGADLKLTFKIDEGKIHAKLRMQIRPGMDLWKMCIHLGCGEVKNGCTWSYSIPLEASDSQKQLRRLAKSILEYLDGYDREKQMNYKNGGVYGGTSSDHWRFEEPISLRNSSRGIGSIVIQ